MCGHRNLLQAFVSHHSFLYGAARHVSPEPHRQFICDDDIPQKRSFGLVVRPEFHLLHPSIPRKLVVRAPISATDREAGRDWAPIFNFDRRWLCTRTCGGHVIARSGLVLDRTPMDMPYAAHKHRLPTILRARLLLCMHCPISSTTSARPSAAFLVCPDSPRNSVRHCPCPESLNLVWLD